MKLLKGRKGTLNLCKIYLITHQKLYQIVLVLLKVAKSHHSKNLIHHLNKNLKKMILKRLI